MLTRDYFHIDHDGDALMIKSSGSRSLYVMWGLSSLPEFLKIQALENGVYDREEGFVVSFQELFDWVEGC